MAQPSGLRIRGARQNNLKNISLEIPHDRLTVVTGVSGSGKSSLAFDTLFAEGQWRYIESLSTYARMFLDRVDRPDVDRIEQIRPAVALEQKNPVRTARSTVGTATEVYDYLRLLYAKVGRVHCPSCGGPATSHSPDSLVEALLTEHEGARALIGFRLPLPAGQERKPKTDQRPGALVLRQECLHQTVRRVRGCRPSATRAVHPANLGVEEAQVVVHLGCRAHRGAGRADGILLLEGDGRTDLFDPIDVGTVDAIEEHAGVGR